MPTLNMFLPMEEQLPHNLYNHYYFIRALTVGLLNMASLMPPTKLAEGNKWACVAAIPTKLQNPMGADPF